MLNVYLPLGNNEVVFEFKLNLKYAKSLLVMLKNVEWNLHAFTLNLPPACRDFKKICFCFETVNSITEIGGICFLLPIFRFQIMSPSAVLSDIEFSRKRVRLCLKTLDLFVHSPPACTQQKWQPLKAFFHRRRISLQLRLLVGTYKSCQTPRRQLKEATAEEQVV